MPAWSGLYNGEYLENYAPLGSTKYKENAYRILGTMFGKRTQSRAVVRELLYSLVGGNVGDPASSTHKRAQATQDLTANVQGGARVIESYIDINRVTTAADVTRIQGVLRQSAQPNYTTGVDKSGNGGGGKGGF